MRGQVNANPNIKRYPCPECIKKGNTERTFTKSGLRGHRLFVHDVPAEKQIPPVANLAANQVVTNSPAAINDKKSEENIMAEEHKHDDNCPECLKRSQQILSLASEVKSAKESIAKLQTELASVPEPVAEIPSDLQLVVDHCENGECVEHKKQWDEIKARIVKGALENIPSSIIETEGLKRGLIPQKIVIRG